MIVYLSEREYRRVAFERIRNHFLKFRVGHRLVYSYNLFTVLAVEPGHSARVRVKARGDECVHLVFFAYRAQQELGRLIKIPGIGKKTAERLLLELKGKLADATGVSLHAAVDDARQDIANALIALGYNEKESAAAMKQLPADIGTSDGIRQALKLLSKV